MKNEKPKISANEINRFMYCPYQWYYKRTYGSRELNKQYKALNLNHSSHESFYEKGMKHHKSYHTRYQVKCVLVIIVMILVIALIVGGMSK